MKFQVSEDGKSITIFSGNGELKIKEKNGMLHLVEMSGGTLSLHPMASNDVAVQLNGRY